MYIFSLGTFLDILFGYHNSGNPSIVLPAQRPYLYANAQTTSPIARSGEGCKNDSAQSQMWIDRNLLIFFFASIAPINVFPQRGVGGRDTLGIRPTKHFSRELDKTLWHRDKVRYLSLKF